MDIKQYVVNASWDPEAKAWIATSEDVPGLCCQAPTFDELLEVALALVPELLVANGVLPAGEAADIPVNVIAERHVVARVAA